jgi:hypothetical protein
MKEARVHSPDDPIRCNDHWKNDMERCDSQSNKHCFNWEDFGVLVMLDCGCVYEQDQLELEWTQ